ncbi:MAG: GntR family transcriptional regulator [Anaerolineales bacterium]
MDLNRVDVEQAYQQIRQMIISLSLAPGETIDPGELASELETSQTSVHEALKLLAQEGLVALPPDGIFVGQVDIPNLRQLSELRILLEGFAARLAAERLSEDDLTILESLRKEQAHIPLEDPPRMFALDHRFHQAIARAAGNDYLAQALERFYGLSLRLWHLALPEPGVLAQAVEEHLDLVDALRSRDAERAERLMQEHVRAFYDRVLEVLEERS